MAASSDVLQVILITCLCMAILGIALFVFWKALKDANTRLLGIRSGTTSAIHSVPRAAARTLRDSFLPDLQKLAVNLEGHPSKMAAIKLVMELRRIADTLEEDARTPQQESVALLDVLDPIADQLRIGGARIQMLIGPRSLPNVLGDKVQLRRVLEQLLNRAAGKSPVQALRLTLVSNHAMVYLDITSLPQEDWEEDRIFEPSENAVPRQDLFWESACSAMVRMGGHLSCFQTSAKTPIFSLSCPVDPLYAPLDAYMAGALPQKEEESAAVVLS